MWPPPTKPKLIDLTFKGYLTLTISTAALVLSLTTAYFTFRHVDDVRMLLPCCSPRKIGQRSGISASCNELTG